jgi:hypothetical protein
MTTAVCWYKGKMSRAANKLKYKAGNILLKGKEL